MSTTSSGALQSVWRLVCTTIPRGADPAPLSGEGMQQCAGPTGPRGHRRSPSHSQTEGRVQAGCTRVLHSACKPKGPLGKSGMQRWLWEQLQTRRPTAVRFPEAESTKPSQTENRPRMFPTHARVSPPAWPPGAPCFPTFHPPRGPPVRPPCFADKENEVQTIE